MKLIPLTQGKFAKVDDADFEWLNQYKWYANKDGNTYYAGRNVRQLDGSFKSQSMHALIANTPVGKHTLHLNGDGLDNQRENLSTGTSADNQRGKRRCYGSTGVRGVHLNDLGRFVVRIKHNYENFHLGTFDTIEAASAARAQKARELGWPV